MPQGPGATNAAARLRPRSSPPALLIKFGFSRSRKMSVKVVQPPSESPSTECHPHLLPCEIRHTGAAPVSAYFKPTSLGDANDVICHFRGRELHGRTRQLPEGYEGLVSAAARHTALTPWRTPRAVGKMRLARPARRCCRTPWLLRFRIARSVAGCSGARSRSSPTGSMTRSPRRPTPWPSAWSGRRSHLFSMGTTRHPTIWVRN